MLGTPAALQRLSHLSLPYVATQHVFKKYTRARNYPGMNGRNMLGEHLVFLLTCTPASSRRVCGSQEPEYSPHFQGDSLPFR